MANLTNIGGPIPVGAFEGTKIDMRGQVPVRSLIYNTTLDALFYRTPEGRLIQVGENLNYYSVISLSPALDLSTLNVGDSYTATVDTNLDWADGDRAIFEHNRTNYFSGLVTSYDSDTGVLTITIDGVTVETGAPAFSVFVVDRFDHIGVDPGGSLSILGRFTNYSALISAHPTASINTLAYINEAEGTQWLPGSLGGNYRARGYYIYTSQGWISDRNQISRALSLVIGNEVQSGAVSGNTLTLTKQDGTTVDVDVTGLNTDSSLTAGTYPVSNGRVSIPKVDGSGNVTITGIGEGTGGGSGFSISATVTDLGTTPDSTRVTISSTDPNVADMSFTVTDGADGESVTTATDLGGGVVQFGTPSNSNIGTADLQGPAGAQGATGPRGFIGPFTASIYQIDTVPPPPTTVPTGTPTWNATENRLEGAGIMDGQPTSNDGNWYNERPSSIDSNVYVVEYIVSQGETGFTVGNPSGIFAATEQGPAGPQGPAGTAGAAGMDGRDPELSIKAIWSNLTANGSIISSAISVGDTLTLTVPGDVGRDLSGSRVSVISGAGTGNERLDITGIVFTRSFDGTDTTMTIRVQVIGSNVTQNIGNNVDIFINLTGRRGATGAAGMNGADGMDGAQGPAGAAGRDGTDGTDGTNGMDGEDGAQGLSTLPPLYSDGLVAAGPGGIIINTADFSYNSFSARFSTSAAGLADPYVYNAVVNPALFTGATYTVPDTSWSTGVEAGSQGPAGPQGPPGTNGMDGDNGMDGAQGDQGLSRVHLYNDDDSITAPPTGVVINTSDFTFTTVPSGWVSNFGAVTDPSVVSFADVNPASFTGSTYTIPDSSWSTPHRSGLQGPPGPAGAQGQRGPAGTNGSDGAAATIAVGTTTTGAAGSNASVTNRGTSSAAIFDFTIPRGDTGAQGAAGAAGTAATISVGTVTTGDPGTNASVTNTGTSSAAVFDFTIPRGADGTGGGGANILNHTPQTIPVTNGSPGQVVLEQGAYTVAANNVILETVSGANRITLGADAALALSLIEGTPGAYTSTFTSLQDPQIQLTYTQGEAITRTWQIPGQVGFLFSSTTGISTLTFTDDQWQTNDNFDVNSLSDLVGFGITQPDVGSQFVMQYGGTEHPQPVTDFINSPLTVQDTTDVFYKGSEIARLTDVPDDARVRVIEQGRQITNHLSSLNDEFGIDFTSIGGGNIGVGVTPRTFALERDLTSITTHSLVDWPGSSSILPEGSPLLSEASLGIGQPDDANIIERAAYREASRELFLDFDSTYLLPPDGAILGKYAGASPTDALLWHGKIITRNPDANVLIIRVISGNDYLTDMTATGAPTVDVDGSLLFSDSNDQRERLLENLFNTQPFDNVGVLEIDSLHSPIVRPIADSTTPSTIDTHLRLTTEGRVRELIGGINQRGITNDDYSSDSITAAWSAATLAANLTTNVPIPPSLSDGLVGADNDGFIIRLGDILLFELITSSNTISSTIFFYGVVTNVSNGTFDFVTLSISANILAITSNQNYASQNWRISHSSSVEALESPKAMALQTIDESWVDTAGGYSISNGVTSGFTYTRLRQAFTAPFTTAGNALNVINNIAINDSDVSFDLNANNSNFQINQDELLRFQRFADVSGVDTVDEVHYFFATVEDIRNTAGGREVDLRIVSTSTGISEGADAGNTADRWIITRSSSAELLSEPKATYTRQIRADWFSSTTVIGPTSFHSNLPDTVGDLLGVSSRTYQAVYTLHQDASSVGPITLYGQPATTTPATLPTTAGTHLVNISWADGVVEGIQQNSPNGDASLVYGSDPNNLNALVGTTRYFFLPEIGGSSIEIQEDGTPEGEAVAINFSTGLDVSITDGIATVTAEPASPTNYHSDAPVLTGLLQGRPTMYSGTYTLHDTASTIEGPSLYGQTATTVPASLPTTPGTHIFQFSWDDGVIESIQNAAGDNAQVFGSGVNNLQLTVDGVRFFFLPQIDSNRTFVKALYDSAQFVRVVMSTDATPVPLFEKRLINGNNAAAATYYGEITSTGLTIWADEGRLERLLTQNFIGS